MKRNELRWILGSLIGTFLFLVADMIGDYAEGADLGHFLIELLSLAFISSGIFLLIRALRNLNHSYTHTQQALVQTSEQLNLKTDEALNWKAQHSRLTEGLAQSIDFQLNQWKLSPAEQDIARLLLKGFSFKEISNLRGTSEKTIRQQAQNIYQKANLPGRAELSAYFLEDFLSPLGPESQMDH